MHLYLIYGFLNLNYLDIKNVIHKKQNFIEYEEKLFVYFIDIIIKMFYYNYKIFNCDDYLGYGIYCRQQERCMFIS